MGCGSSKAAEINEGDITIRARQPDDQTDDQTKNNGDVSNSTARQGTTQQTSENDDSNLNQALQSLPQSPASPQSHHQLLPNELASNQSYLLKPIAYEIPLNEDGKPMPRKPFVPRLEKLDNAPRVTAESLAEKQRRAEERKQKELAKKQKSGSKQLSRIKRDIMVARNADIYNEVERKIGSGKKGPSAQLAVPRSIDRVKPVPEEDGGSGDLSVEMEGDNTFNADSNGEDLWGNSHSHSQMHHKTNGLAHHQQLTDSSTHTRLTNQPAVPPGVKPGKIHYSTVVT